MSDTPTHDEVLRFMNDLDKGTNLMGPLSPEIRARLYAVVDKPNQETWADAHTIIISGMTTLWQALLKHTDYDVTSGPSYAQGEAPGPWPKLPTSDQMLIAIRAELSRS